MFVLTETAKAMQNINSPIVDTILSMITVLCIVLLVLVVMEGRK